MGCRHALSWKSGFYGALLPLLGRLGPVVGDAVLGGVGRAAAALPPRRGALERSLAVTRNVLDADWNGPAARSALGAGIVRSLARDYLLDHASDAEVARRFAVEGFETVTAALAEGRGAIVLGCHLGAHVAGIHWLMRQQVPLRLLVQRPWHVSGRLQRWFDRLDGAPHPQAEFFLRRDLTPGEAVRRVFLARDALRAGQLVYLNGDIPWPTPSARSARFLGVQRPFLSLWADLAARTGVPVVRLFATHEAGGRYALWFDAVGPIRPGEETAAVRAYLQRLEQWVAQRPGDAVPYLTWKTYTRGQPPDRRRRPAGELGRAVSAHG
jgi:lauroyl/myristoyl acyltransferase